MLRIFLLVFVGLMLQSCLNLQPQDLKSPCAAVITDDSELLEHNPCIKRPVNIWRGLS